MIESISDPPTAKPSQAAIGETAVKINGDWSWVYSAISLDSQLVLDVAFFGQRGTDPAAAFVHRLAEKHDLSRAVFLVDGYGYLTALSRFRLGDQFDYVDQNLIETWFHISKCVSTASTTHGWAIGKALEVILINLYISIKRNNPISHSANRR